MLKNKFIIVKILFLLYLFLLTGCSSTRISDKERSRRVVKISSFYREWKGTKYRLGGTSKAGVDCSALMGRLYIEKFNMKLPRTTEKMVLEGEKVKNRNQWEVGDLVFFKIGRKKVRHVGVYLGDNRFLHASTSRGVIISNIDGYWNEHLWKVKKIL
ncbi:C40 family peptidase [Cetobacterium sp.]|uniref:C40 family peptidase n=1 Tax=Cetobacterium sp. TaxID=2071632 RepID=UPI003F664366